MSTSYKNIELHKKFLRFEDEYDLFSQENPYMEYWDVIRYCVFIQIEHGVAKKKEGVLFIEVIKFFFGILWFLFFVLSKFRRGTYFFFLASRNKYKGFFIDQNVENVLNYTQTISSKIVLYESYKNDKSKYSVVSDYSSTIFGGIKRFIKVNRIDFILDQIEKIFEVQLDRKEIYTELKRFKFDQFYYRLIFKVLNTKTVFLTQNGIQKGLIQACFDLKIKSIELQHGVVDESHMAYSYSKYTLKSNKCIITTEFIFSFSPFWFKEFNCHSEIISIGNDFFVNENVVSGMNQVLIISSKVHSSFLMPLAKEMSDQLIGVKIIFKLHPSEFKDLGTYVKYFEGNTNIQIVTNEYSVKQLIETSSELIAIASTAVYEALQCGLKVYIYKKSNYYRHNHILDFPNVHIIDNLEDFFLLRSKLSKEIEISEPFFLPFNKSKIKDFFEQSI